VRLERIFTTPNRSRPGMRVFCVNNLRQIDAAKEQWALETKKNPGDDVNVNEMALYIKGEKIPVCPKGGKYTIGKVGEKVICSFPGHTLH
jgi:hypothetical protein